MVHWSNINYRIMRWIICALKLMISRFFHKKWNLSWNFKPENFDKWSGYYCWVVFMKEKHKGDCFQSESCSLRKHQTLLSQIRYTRHITSGWEMQLYINHVHFHLPQVPHIFSFVTAWYLQSHNAEGSHA